MFITSVLWFAVTFKEAHFIQPRIYPAVVHAVEAATENPLPLGETREEQILNTAKLEIEWGYNESRLDPKAVGSNNDCGIVQINSKSVGMTCKELQNPKVAFTKWLEIAHRETTRCGTVKKALGAMSTKGVCGGAPSLVTRRCAHAGVPC